MRVKIGWTIFGLQVSTALAQVYVFVVWGQPVTILLIAVLVVAARFQYRDMRRMSAHGS